METLNLKSGFRLGLFSAAMLTGGVVILPGCTSTASDVCALQCECTKCSDRAREECENDVSAAEDQAAAFECKDDFDAYADCVIDRADCNDNSLDISDCEDDLQDLNECIADASDIVGATGTTPAPGGDPGATTPGTPPGNGGSFDNAAACNAWLANAVCSDFDFSTAIDCDTLGMRQCDLAPYFSCLTANFICNDGIPDTSGFSNCTALTVCG
ncbi:MAG: hypothetical protein AAGA56_30430 [Myxococcota bacterium]